MAGSLEPASCFFHEVMRMYIHMQLSAITALIEDPGACEKFKNTANLCVVKKDLDTICDALGVKL